MHTVFNLNSCCWSVLPYTHLL